MPPATTADFHPQDWALIVETLVTWAGNPTDLGDPRKQRAYELVEMIAADQGLTPSELVANIDSDWQGDRQRTRGAYSAVQDEPG